MILGLSKSNSYKKVNWANLVAQPGFATKAFHSKAKLKRLNILGSYVRLSFWDSEILKVLRLSALTGLIRIVLLRLSEISKAEMGLRQI